jgi:hypothetical protein
MAITWIGLFGQCCHSVELNVTTWLNGILPEIERNLRIVVRTLGNWGGRKEEGSEINRRYVIQKQYRRGSNSPPLKCIEKKVGKSSKLFESIKIAKMLGFFIPMSQEF